MLKYLGIKEIDTLNELSNHIEKENCVCLCVYVCLCAYVHEFMGWEDPLEKGKATHSSILAWGIPWTV